MDTVEKKRFCLEMATSLGGDLDEIKRVAMELFEFMHSPWSVDGYENIRDLGYVKFYDVVSIKASGDNWDIGVSTPIEYGKVFYAVMNPNPFDMPIRLQILAGSSTIIKVALASERVVNLYGVKKLMTLDTSYKWDINELKERFDGKVQDDGMLEMLYKYDKWRRKKYGGYELPTSMDEIVEELKKDYKCVSLKSYI